LRDIVELAPLPESLFLRPPFIFIPLFELTALIEKVLESGIGPCPAEDALHLSHGLRQDRGSEFYRQSFAEIEVILVRYGDIPSRFVDVIRYWFLISLRLSNVSLCRARYAALLLARGGRSGC